MFSRPEPQAFWRQRLSSKIWNNASGSFLSASSLDDNETSGKWSLKSNLLDRWEMSYDNIKFYATPTAFQASRFFS